MSFGVVDSLSAALFCFAMVFTLLGSLYGLVRLFSVVVGAIEGKSRK